MSPPKHVYESPGQCARMCPACHAARPADPFAPSGRSPRTVAEMVGMRVEFGPDERHALLAQVAEIQRERDEARAQAEALRTAARAARDWAWNPDEDATEQFERIADDFYRATGMLRPGKSEPAECGGGEAREAERRESWERWRTEQSRKVHALLSAALKPSAAKERP